MSPVDPPTEPLDPLPPSTTADSPLPDPPSSAPIGGPFSRTEFRFTTGVRSGEVAPVRGENGETLLTYRSFAGVVGVIAALVSGIVAVVGIASAVFLYRDSPLRAVAAIVLTVVFTFFITLLVPRVTVTLFDGAEPALTITQRTIFPSAAFVVSAPNGARLAEIRKSFFSRLGRHRWSVWHEHRLVGEAFEDTFFGAVVRKFLGKFSRKFETNVVVTHGGIEVARIVRRPDATGRVDTLDVLRDALDRRVLVALATVVLGREP